MLNRFSSEILALYKLVLTYLRTYRWTDDFAIAETGHRHSNLC